MAQLCLHVDDELKRLLDAEAQRSGLNRSEAARRAILRGLAERSPEDTRTLDQKLAPYIGVVDLGVPDLGERHSNYVRERIRRRAGLSS